MSVLASASDASPSHEECPWKDKQSAFGLRGAWLEKRAQFFEHGVQLLIYRSFSESVFGSFVSSRASTEKSIYSPIRRHKIFVVIIVTVIETFLQLRPVISHGYFLRHVRGDAGIITTLKRRFASGQCSLAYRVIRAGITNRLYIKK